MPGDRVLLLTVAAERGGAEAVMETVASGLDRSRFEPVMAGPAGSSLVRRWRDAGWSVVETPVVPRLRDLRAGSALVQDLERQMEEHDIAIVHTHGVAAQIFGGLAARRTRRPVVWHLHDMMPSGWSMYRGLSRLAAAQRCDVAVAISKVVADSVRGDVPAARLRLIANGVSSETVAPPPALTAEPGTPLVVWCGRLQQWKGPDTFLQVAAQVSVAHPNARFAIVGGSLFGLEADYPAKLRTLAMALGVDSSIEWVGQVSDARPWFAASDVVVHSSTTPEPFGLVVVEAMMQSRPVVAFRHGGPAETVVDGRTGTLVPPGDVTAMSAAVSAMLGDPAGASAMGAAARLRALEHYEASVMVRHIESAYDHVRA